MNQPTLTEAQRKVLIANLNPDRITHRRQGNSNLSYLEAFDVKATLIRVFGFGGFSAEVIDSKIERILTGEEAGTKTKWTVLASATVRLTIHQTGAVYTEAAASSQAGSQIGEVADFAIKTAESDALKRAAIYLGTQFGLSLYNAGSNMDVVKKVFAPGQEWPPAQPQQAAEEVVQTEVIRTPTAEEEVENLQQIADGGDNSLPAGNGITPEQRAQNEALLDRAVNMRRERDAEAATQNAD